MCIALIARAGSLGEEAGQVRTQRGQVLPPVRAHGRGADARGERGTHEEPGEGGEEEGRTRSGATALCTQVYEQTTPQVCFVIRYFALCCVSLCDFLNRSYSLCLSESLYVHMGL